MTGNWPANWATGDVLFASEYKKGIGAISDTTLGAPAANVDITSIVATYAHLMVVVYARCDVALASSPINLRFNGDSAANYDTQELQCSGTGVNPSEIFAQTWMIAGHMPANTAGANLFGVSIGFIPHYAGSANNKMCLALSAIKTGVTAASMANTLGGGFWRSNAAVNRITLLPSSGNFVAGTRVTLYGMGA